MGINVLIAGLSEALPLWLRFFSHTFTQFLDGVAVTPNLTLLLSLHLLYLSLLRAQADLKEEVFLTFRPYSDLTGLFHNVPN
jgi:hypothetical protein